MCKSDSIFPNLQSNMVFEWFLKFISSEGFSQKWVIAVLEEKCPSFNFIH